MSKAFTRESDDAPEPLPLPRLASALPPGAKNYLTPEGARRLQSELETLLQERTRASNPPSLEQRILRLRQGLESAVVVAPSPPPWEQVRFGSTVTVRHANGERSHYRIVGVDETDVNRGWVSWLSPIAKALLNARLGERVQFRFPAGEEQLEVIGVTFTGEDPEDEPAPAR